MRCVCMYIFGKLNLPTIPNVCSPHRVVFRLWDYVLDKKYSYNRITITTISSSIGVHTRFASKSWVIGSGSGNGNGIGNVVMANGK